VRDAASKALNSMGISAVIVGLATLMRSGNAELPPDRPGDGPQLEDSGWARVVTRLLKSGE
jgi:hypothetical protein